MRRTTHYRHGLSIGWGDIFFLYGVEGDEHLTRNVNYHAVVELNGPTFANITQDNYFVATLAQQVLWSRVGDECLRTYVLRPTIRQWLVNNIGECGPEWYVRPQPFELFFQAILFRRKKDALCLVRFVEECLEGSERGRSKGTSRNR